MDRVGATLKYAEGYRSPVSSRRRIIVVLTILAPLLTSGCLGPDFLPEPWVWRDAGAVEGSFDGPDERTTRSLDLHPRTDRVRVVLTLTLESPGSDLLGSVTGEGPGANVTVQLEEDRAYTYRFHEAGTREVRDLYPAVDGGTLGVTVVARGQGSWNVTVEAHEPLHDDYAWWKVWLPR